MRSIQDLAKIVHAWAPQHASEDYWYGSRQSYWAAALSNKIVTRDEYDFAAAYYANLWTYRGD